MCCHSSEYLPVISDVPKGQSLATPILTDVTTLDVSKSCKVMLYSVNILLYRPVSSDNDFVTLQSDITYLGQLQLHNF